MGGVHLNHPDAGAATTTNSRSTPGEQEHEVRSGGEEEPSAVALTVWRKLLLLGCQDMTVFDSRGDLAFRVDCYASSRRRADIVLMGAAGEPLLMVRCARRLGDLLAAERWFIYDGDGATPVLSVCRDAPSRPRRKRWLT